MSANIQCKPKQEALSTNKDEKHSNKMKKYWSIKVKQHIASTKKRHDW